MPVLWMKNYNCGAVAFLEKIKKSNCRCTQGNGKYTTCDACWRRCTTICIITGILKLDNYENPESLEDYKKWFKNFYL
jgi:hypothetical protein